MIKTIFKNLFARFQSPNERYMWRVYEVIYRAPPAGVPGYDHTKAVPFAVCYPDGNPAPRQPYNFSIALSGYPGLRGLQKGDIVAEEKTLGGGLEIVAA